MKIIWFNPDSNTYEKGDIQKFKEKSSLSQNSDRFDILYEFEDPSDKLIDKILQSLNLVRGTRISTR